LNEEDVLLAEAQLRVRGKGHKLRFLPLARKPCNSSITIAAGAA